MTETIARWGSTSCAGDLTEALPDAVVPFCAIYGAFAEKVDIRAEDAVVSGRFSRLYQEAPRLTVVETNLESCRHA